MCILRGGSCGDSDEAQAQRASRRRRFDARALGLSGRQFRLAKARPLRVEGFGAAQKPAGRGAIAAADFENGSVEPGVGIGGVEIPRATKSTRSLRDAVERGKDQTARDPGIRCGGRELDRARGQRLGGNQMARVAAQTGELGKENAVLRVRLDRGIEKRRRLGGATAA